MIAKNFLKYHRQVEMIEFVNLLFECISKFVCCPKFDDFRARDRDRFLCDPHPPQFNQNQKQQEEEQQRLSEKQPKFLQQENCIDLESL